MQPPDESLDQAIDVTSLSGGLGAPVVGQVIRPSGAPQPASQPPPEATEALEKTPRQKLSLAVPVLNGPAAIAALVTVTMVALAGLGGMLFLNHNRQASTTQKPLTDNYAVKSLPLQGTKPSDELSIKTNDRLAINGQLRVNQGLVLAPTATPANPETGQVYLNKDDKQLYYYNGSQFVSMATDKSVAAAVALQVAQNPGTINRVGAGLALSGTTISNTGVLEVHGTVNQINTNVLGGLVTLSLPQDIATGSSVAFGQLKVNGGPAGSTAVLQAGGDVDITGDYKINGATICTSGGCTVGSLPPDVTRQGNTFNGVSQLVQLTNTGILPALNAINLTSLNASNIDNGTLGDNRLSANVTVQGNTFNGAGQLVQLDGSLQLPVASGVFLTNLNASNIASGTLNDGRLSANVTLQGNTFNGPSQLVQLDGSSRLPAANGSLLTNLNASALTSGTINDARLSANVTLQGNVFNGASQLIQANASGELPIISGANLTNLNAASLASGTVPDARLSGNVSLLGQTIEGTEITDGTITNADISGSAAISDTKLGTIATAGKVADTALSANVTLQGNSFNGVNQLVQTTISGALPVLSGANLTNLNASNITSGTLAVAQGGTGAGNAAGARSNLGAAANGANGDITSLTALTAITPGAALTIGATSQQLVLQGSATTLTQTNGGFTSTVSFTTPSANQNIAFPDASGTVCLTSGNCLGGGAGGANTALSNLSGVAINASLVPAGFGTIDLGSAAKPFRNLYVSDSSQSFGFQLTGAALTQNKTLTLPNFAGTTANVCLDIGNCAGSGSGVTTTGGTINFLPIYSASQQITNSIISQDVGATTATVNGNLSVTGTASGNGSGLTNLNASNLSSGTVSDARLSANVTLQGNAFNGASQLVQLTAGGLLPALNGVNLTNLNAGNIASGTLSDSRLAADVSLLGSSIDSSEITDGTIVNADISNTAAIADTKLNTIVTAGKVADTALSTNVALLNRNSQTFTGSQIFQNGADTTSAFQIQNHAGTSNLVIADTINNRIAINQATASYAVDVNGDVNIGASNVYRIGGAVICTSTGCSAASGSSSYIQNGTTPQTANFNITGNGTIGGALSAATLTGNGAGLTALNASSLATGTVADARLSVNVTTQGNTFNGASQLVQLTGGGLLPVLNGSNLTALNATNLSSGTVSDTRLSANVALLNGTGPQTFTGNNKFTGTVLLQNASNSTTAFQVSQAVGGNVVLNVDTTNQRVGIGTIAPISTLQVGGTLTVGTAASAGSVGVAQLTTGGASPIANRLTFGTDGSGWKFAISKNQGGTVTDLMILQDNGSVVIGTSSGGTLTLGSASSTPMLLVLGTKNTAGDPTCTNGAIYYNSSTNQSKICINSGWTAVGVPKVTALPGSPSDGDEVYYDLGSTQAGVLWHLRYNSSTGYWDYVGGAALTSSRDGQFLRNCGCWGNTTENIEPTVTAPLAGDYEMTLGAWVEPVGSLFIGYASISISGSGPVSDDGIVFAENSGSAHVVMEHTRVKTFAAGNSIAMSYYGSSYFTDRHVGIRPIRVH